MEQNKNIAKRSLDFRSMFIAGVIAVGLIVLWVNRGNWTGITSQIDSVIHTWSHTTTKPAPKIENADGVIRYMRFDLKKHPYFQVQAKGGGNMPLYVHPGETTVWQNGKQLELQHLHLGDHVDVRYLIEKKRNHAKSVEILQMKSMETRGLAANQGRRF